MKQKTVTKRHTRRVTTGLTIISAVALAVMSTPVAAMAASPSPTTSSARSSEPAASMASKPEVRQLCSDTKAKNIAKCFAQRVVSPPKMGIQPQTAAPQGLAPADLLSAYNLPANGGAGQTIATIVAMDSPNALADLEVYRAQFGLPALKPGQFKKVNQRGEEGNYPPADEGWAGEASLDLDMVSAIAPNANIILVEADTATFEDLGAAVNQAVAMGAKYVSNSYGTGYDATPGSGEDSGVLAYDEKYYNHPGVAVVASSGDSDFGVTYPSSSKYVTSVGGTALVKDSSARGWSESVWHNSYGGPGSGCSIVQDKPAFQNGVPTGCDMRAAADVSAVADPATGVAVYNSYGSGTGWAIYGGTSASSPIIAGTYALAGAAAAGTYPNAFPYAKSGALNDVTTGLNGTCTPKVLCTAGAGWDGPTSLGTPSGTAAFASGPYGTVKGKITDTATGEPVVGAKVTIGVASTLTNDEGAYTTPVDPGTYDETIAVYGYAPKTIKGVVVTEDATVTKNVALTKMATATLSGTVKDGSGHGWPIYSKITVEGVPGAPIHTDPYTGRYTIDLPKGATYKVHVDANYPGYVSSDTSVKLTGNHTTNVSLKVDPMAGSAPGYTSNVSGGKQTFDGETVPAGWTVQATEGDGWAFNNPQKSANDTGGTGNFATINTSLDDPKSTDATMTAPVVDLSTSDNPIVAFDSFYRGIGGQQASVEYSIDNGKTWLTAWEQVLPQSGHVRIPLPKAAGKSGAQVRFHYVSDLVGFPWQLDNVQIGQPAVTKIPGGIVAGTVTDSGSVAVNNATITNKADATERTTSTATPDDSALADGFFWMFNKGAGARTYDATKVYTGGASISALLKADAVTKTTAVLQAGRVEVTPASIKKTVDWQGSTTANVKLTNTGAGPANVTVSESPAAPVALAQKGAPLHKVKVNAITGSLAVAAKKSKAPKSVQQDVTPSDSTWQSGADLPVALAANVAGVNNGVLYTAFGFDGNTDVADLYAYDSVAGKWTKKASAQDVRETPTNGWIDGRWYINGGTSGYEDGADAKTEVYDPATNAWSTVAENPAPVYSGGSAVLGGKLYSIAGCDVSSCRTVQVQTYDPATDQWTVIADYPEASHLLSCGAITGAVYCAGGIDATGDVLKSTYKYDPSTNKWTKMADMPVALFGSDSTVANGMLLVSGGMDGYSSLTNEGYAFNAAKNTWTPLPNANKTIYRGAGALGFYRVGGIDTGFTPDPAVEFLPGFDQPTENADVDWMSVNVTKVALAPGQSKNVKVTLNADLPEITQPGTLTAALTFRTDTQTPVSPVPVTLTVKNPKTWGQITGVVKDESGAGVAGATVEIDSWASNYTLKTDKDGKYGLWLDTRNNPLTLIVAKDGFRPTTAKVKITKGATVTQNFVLKKP